MNVVRLAQLPNAEVLIVVTFFESVTDVNEEQPLNAAVPIVILPVALANVAVSSFVIPVQPSNALVPNFVTFVKEVNWKAEILALSGASSGTSLTSETQFLKA